MWQTTIVCSSGTVEPDSSFLIYKSMIFMKNFQAENSNWLRNIQFYPFKGEGGWDTIPAISLERSHCFLYKTTRCNPRVRSYPVDRHHSSVEASWCGWARWRRSRRTRSGSPRSVRRRGWWRSAAAWGYRRCVGHTRCLQPGTWVSWCTTANHTESATRQGPTGPAFPDENNRVPRIVDTGPSRSWSWRNRTRRSSRSGKAWLHWRQWIWPLSILSTRFCIPSSWAICKIKVLNTCEVLLLEKRAPLQDRILLWLVVSRIAWRSVGMPSFHVVCNPLPKRERVTLLWWVYWEHVRMGEYERYTPFPRSVLSYTANSPIQEVRAHELAEIPISWILHRAHEHTAIQDDRHHLLLLLVSSLSLSLSLVTF